MPASDLVPSIHPGVSSDVSGIVRPAGAVGATFTPAGLSGPGGGRQRGRRVPLGSYAGSVSAEGGDSPGRAPVARRYRLQRVAQQALPAHRVAHCMRHMTGAAVDVLYHPEHSAASYGGLQTCGNAWVCPVCSTKILQRRGEEIGCGVASWQAKRGDVLMLTLTLRHERGPGLAEYLNGLNEAYRKLRNGRPWRRFAERYGLRGSITRREITHGASGWHPHLHALLFLERAASTDELKEIEKYIKTQWIKFLHKLGFDASVERGADIRPAGKGADDYITKLSSQWSVAKEVSDSGTKKALHGSETIAQILQRAEAGEASAVQLYREYAQATAGKAIIVWSKGLRAALLSDETEKSDEEIAAEQTAEARGLVALNKEQWQLVYALNLRGELLAVAAAGDENLLASWLNMQGVGLHSSQIGRPAGEKWRPY